MLGQVVGIAQGVCMKLIHTCNFARDYPDEKEVLNLPALSEVTLSKIATLINDEINNGRVADRFYMVVPCDHVLQPGFEP
jgi:hypothetical protein